MASLLSRIAAVVLPKAAPVGGTSVTPTYFPTNQDVYLPRPIYRDHLRDIFDDRQALDSRQLMQQMFREDPDVSATVNAFLTVANTQLTLFVKDQDGKIDRAGHTLLQQILHRFTTRTDYSTGFQRTSDLDALTEEMRFMVLLRGGAATELVVDATFLPTEVRHVDLAQIEWRETTPGQYKPRQRTRSTATPIDLDIPTFFTSWFRKDPTNIYSYSPFVSAINTIAARQQVINDLYRLMRVMGYPRLDIKVVEEVLRKNAPPSAQESEEGMKVYIAQRMGEISRVVGTLQPDEAFVHMDSVEADTFNPNGAKGSMDVTAVIATLNAQNQAALKTMATIIGRGESGTNTASVEARIFSLSAQEVNRPVAMLLGQMLTMALRLQGFPGYVEAVFANVEMRSALELEPQLVTKQARLLEALSLGVISDDEFHISMYGRIRPDSAPVLSGTNFIASATPAVNTDQISPNSDPLGRSVTPSGTKGTKSAATGAPSGVKKTNTPKPKSTSS